MAPGTDSRYHAKSSPPRLCSVWTCPFSPTTDSTARASTAVASGSLTTGGTPRT